MATSSGESEFAGAETYDVPVPRRRGKANGQAAAQKTSAHTAWESVIGNDLIAIRANGDIDRVTGPVSKQLISGDRKTDDAYKALILAAVDLKCEVKGLGEGETLPDRWTFDNERYAEVLHVGPGEVNGEIAATVNRWRTAQLRTPSGKDDERSTWTVVPLFPGRFSVSAVTSDVAVIRDGDDRFASHERGDFSYTVRYTSREGDVEGDTVITDRQLYSKGTAEWSWMTKLGVSFYVAQGKKGPLIRNALRSVFLREVERGNVPRIRAVDQTGLMFAEQGDASAVFAASAEIIGTEGFIDNLRIRLPKEVMKENPHKAFSFSRSTGKPDESFAALADLASLTVNVGSAFLLGCLTSIPYASLYETARGSSLIVGGTTCGKTSLCSVFVAAQSPKLRPKDKQVSVRTRSNKNGRGSTTFKGMAELLSKFTGLLLLTDDAVKEKDKGAVLENAGILFDQLTTASTPGDGGIKQATLDRDNPDKSTKLADSGFIAAHALTTAEKMPLSGPVDEDSTLNRAMIIPHFAENRCALDMWESVTTADHGRRANRGWTLYIQWVCANPRAWEAVYEAAEVELTHLLGRDRERIAQVHAVRIAGLRLLEMAALSHGVTLDLAGRAIAGLPAMLDQVRMIGQETSEERATANLYDSVRENVRRVVAKSGYFAAAKYDDQREVDTFPELTPDGDEDFSKYGVIPEHLGWRANLASEGSALHKPIGSTRIGYAKMMDDPKASYFPNEPVVIMVGSDFNAFVESVNASANRFEQLSGSRAEIKAVLALSDIAEEYREPMTGRRGVIVKLVPFLVDSLDDESGE